MKVFNLKCDGGHPFEGWFKSHQVFETQQAGGLLSCPFCESRVVHKTLSAPRLNLSTSESEPGSQASGQASSIPSAPSGPQQTVSHPQAATLAAALTVVRQMLANSEDVGGRFAEEARAIFAQESPARPIHGSTSLETAQELAEEGIPIVAIPFPGLLKTSLQ